MRYCSRCILPDTRPNLRIEADGVCNACHSQAEKRTIDWPSRERAFAAAADRAKAVGNGYDCIIPVSGGKDSTWQVIECLEYGLNPLAVTWKTPARTELGAKNLANLIRLGVDHIDYQINPKVERKFMRLALERFGSTAIPMHLALFSIPLNIAARFRIPLVVWGENSAFEYGGEGEEKTGFALTAEWLRRHGVTHGASARDWVCAELSEKELTPYFCPSEAELAANGVLAVFLGYYFPWDPQVTLEAARSHGFTSRQKGPKTGYYDYADIDDDFISIHHWLKWYKFGFTRLFDNLSLEIRNNRISREQAVEIVRSANDQTPHEDIEQFCAFVDMSPKRFFKIAERFRNHSVWTRRDGTWMIENFLIPDWRW